MKRIKLSNGKYALVDNKDYKRLNKKSWHYVKQGNYARNGTSLMHYQIMPAPSGFCVDHIDRNGLNNCRNNLRICTRKENCRNRRKITKTTSSKYKGVWWHKKHNKWAAMIQVNEKKISLGLFEKERDAAISYDTAARIFYGQYAFLNMR